MPANIPPAPRIAIEGEWSIERAADLAKLVAESVGRLVQAEPRISKAEIDMAGLSRIDGCGCQLLAVFLENLRRHGITPLASFLRPELREKIDSLGFAKLFDGPAAAEEATR